MFNDYGLRATDKSKIRKMRDRGVRIKAMAASLLCAESLVVGYLNTQDKGLTAVQPQVFDMSDEFGPLNGTADWLALAPQKKAAITRQRNAAAA